MSWLPIPSSKTDGILRFSLALLLLVFNWLVSTRIDVPYPSAFIEAYSIPLLRIALLSLVVLAAMWCPTVGILAAFAYVSLGADVLFLANRSL